MEKIGKVSDVDDYEVVLSFPRGAIVRGQLWKSVNVPHHRKRSGYVLQAVKCFEHLATIDEIYKANEKELAHIENHSKSKDKREQMQADIKENGIRHHPVVDADMRIAYGHTRIHCLKDMGEAIVTVYRCAAGLDEIR